jgi:hypothetical protein
VTGFGKIARVASWCGISKVGRRCRGQFPDTGDTESWAKARLCRRNRFSSGRPLPRPSGAGSGPFVVDRAVTRVERKLPEKIAAAAKEKQPGEFRRWGRNHKNSASGCHSYFTVDGAGLQTSDKPGLECPGCIWKSSTKMRRQPEWMGAAPTGSTTRQIRHQPGSRESGGIGRRARLRIWCRKAWGFESPLSHSPTTDSGEAGFSPHQAFSRICLDGLLSVAHNSQSPRAHHFHLAKYFCSQTGYYDTVRTCLAAWLPNVRFATPSCVFLAGQLQDRSPEVVLGTDMDCQRRDPSVAPTGGTNSGRPGRWSNRPSRARSLKATCRHGCR